MRLWKTAVYIAGMNTSTKCASTFRKLGFDITVRSDGDLIFTDEGVPFLVMVEEQDPTYLHIILSGIRQAKNLSDDDRIRTLQILNEVNSETKVAKLIYLASGAVFASAEAICPTTAAARKIIPQILSHLKLAGFRFDQAFFGNAKETGQLVLIR